MGKNEDYLTESEHNSIRAERLDRRLYRLYEIGIKWVPIGLMFAHWYGVFDYGTHLRPVFIDTDDNGLCIIWLYILAYIYMPLAMIPASYFFHYCWIFRIPFIYFFGINAIRLYYGNWLIRPEQMDAHYIFIIFTIILYAYGLGKIALERSKVCTKNAGKR